MWIIAGPNGAGKSTFTASFLEELSLTDLLRLNADEVTAQLRSRNPNEDQNSLNLNAARMVDAKVAEYIEAGTSFLVETVLSSGKYRDDLEAAKTAGYKTAMVYISLYPPELSPRRVGERVLKGGHAVDAATAIKRYHRSHQELAWFASRVDMLMVFDNSAPDGRPVLLFEKIPRTDMTASLHFKSGGKGLNPEIDRAVRIAFGDIP
jgi:predicted ABC-type ATPase